MSTEPTEQDEALTEALIEALAAATDGQEGEDLAADLLTAITPAIAAIRRHAKAEALREQSARLFRVGDQHLETANAHPNGSAPRMALLAWATQARVDARYLGRAAEAIIQEGWEHACAAEFPATREEPGYGCENPVENEGDYCARHEPEDDHDPRGEL